MNKVTGAIVAAVSLAVVVVVVVVVVAVIVVDKDGVVIAAIAQYILRMMPSRM